MDFLGKEYPLYIYFQPSKLEDGSILLSLKDFSVGTLKLPKKTVMQVLSTNKDLPDFVKIDSKEATDVYKRQGLDGVVCSAHEVDLIKKATSEEFVCVTPGIRPAGAEIGDQKRVMTPQEAHAIGSDYIVVGRPIIQAENPWDAYHEIKRQWNS